MPAWQRNQIAAQAADMWGLTRKQVRDRVNRGTYQPLGPDPARMIPRGRDRRPLQRVEVLRQRALIRVEGLFAGRLRWNPQRQEQNLSRATPAAISQILAASDEELLDAINRRPRRGDWFWAPGDINILWYG